jgi:hypothetical protein
MTSKGDNVRFEELYHLKKSEWEYEFYREEKYVYMSSAMAPSPRYEIRALYYSDGYLLTLARLANEEEFRDKPQLLQALKMGPFDGHQDTIERCMDDTLWKIGNAIKRALEKSGKKTSK